MSAKNYLSWQFNHLRFCLNKLENYYQFTNGWHCGDGEAYPESTLSKVKELLIQTVESGFVKFDLYPGSEGSIQLHIYLEEWVIEITVYVGILNSIYVEDPMGSTHLIEDLSDYKKALETSTQLIATIENFRNNQED